MKEKDRKTIWRVPKYLPYIQPSLTDEIIEQAEKKIGYKLPKEYLELLKIQNGGYIRFALKDTPHSQISGIGPYYPSITDFDWLSEYDDLSFDIKGLFPFDGDGHWNICLDYRKNKIDPEVTYIDTESDYEKHIATTFNNYLHLLEIETENEYVIETNSNIDTLLKQISETANIEFEEPDYWAHGYPVFRGNLKDSWIWISPNISPSGFIREDDERYIELKSQMETTALRYPEIPESSLLISVSEEHVRQELFTKLTTSGIKIRELKEYV
jgi:hypothetical protein